MGRWTIGSLTLDQLRVLVTVAEVGSFSAAGRRLGRAQSAISQAVATLEGVHGVVLFDRSGFRPVLTQAGRVLAAQARTVLAGAARFEAMAATTREGVEPELAIAIDPLAPTDAFIDSLHALRAAFPSLSVSFRRRGWAAPNGGCGAARRRWPCASCCRSRPRTWPPCRSWASTSYRWWRPTTPWRGSGARRPAPT